MDVPKRIDSKPMASCVLKSFPKIGWVCCCDPADVFKRGISNFPKEIIPPAIFCKPTSMVSKATKIPGIIIDIIPKAANRKPSNIISQVRGNGPTGVLPRANICTPKMVISNPSWALGAKGISPKLTGISSNPKSSIKIHINKIITLSVESSTPLPEIFSASGYF